MSSYKEAPVLTPTMAEFEDFNAFIASVEQIGLEHGIVKVRPPPEWLARVQAGCPRMREQMDQMVIPNPIKQYPNGRKGCYELLLMEKEPLTVAQFREQAAEMDARENSRWQQRQAEKDYDFVEQSFWKNLSYGEPPVYGADMVGTLFEGDEKVWNLDKLDTMLQKVLLQSELPGVLNSYLYFGMWRALFGIHVEDMDLYSINFLHLGKPKSWYSVPSKHCARVESFLGGQYPLLQKECKEFIRHKNTTVSPTVLARESIPLTHTVQEVGEFVITYPHAYHWGFNHGFNCAEATNFASEEWIPYGCKAGTCKCRPDNVRIDMKILQHRLGLMKSGATDFLDRDHECPGYEHMQHGAAEAVEAPPAGAAGGGGRMMMMAAEEEPKPPEAAKKKPPVQYDCVCHANTPARRGRHFACDECGKHGHIDCYMDFEGLVASTLPKLKLCYQCRPGDAAGNGYWQFACVCGCTYMTGLEGELDGATPMEGAAAAPAAAAAAASDASASQTLAGQVYSHSLAPEGDMFECTECKRWAHTQCYNTLLGGSAMTASVDCDNSLCRACVNAQGSKGKARKRLSKAAARAAKPPKPARNPDADDERQADDFARKEPGESMVRSPVLLKHAIQAVKTYYGACSASITHRKIDCAFVLRVKNAGTPVAGKEPPRQEGWVGFLQYELKSATIDLVHTYVPRALRGSGLAEELVSAAFEFAKQKQLLVIPSCTYISGPYLALNPERAEQVQGAQAEQGGATALGSDGAGGRAASKRHSSRSSDVAGAKRSKLMLRIPSSSSPRRGSGGDAFRTPAKDAQPAAPVNHSKFLAFLQQRGSLDEVSALRICRYTSKIYDEPQMLKNCMVNLVMSIKPDMRDELRDVQEQLGFVEILDRVLPSLSAKRRETRLRPEYLGAWAFTGDEVAANAAKLRAAEAEHPALQRKAGEQLRQQAQAAAASGLRAPASLPRPAAAAPFVAPVVAPVMAPTIAVAAPAPAAPSNNLQERERVLVEQILALLPQQLQGLPPAMRAQFDALRARAGR